MITGDLYNEAVSYARKSRSFTSNRHDFHPGGLSNKEKKMFEGKLGEKAIKLFFLDNHISFIEDTSSFDERDEFDFLLVNESEQLKVDVKTRTENFHIRTLEMVEQANTHVHIVLRAAMQQAVESELIKNNPCRKARIPKVTRPEIKPLTDEQIHDFLELATNDDIYGTVLKVILFTGIREGEALGLTWDCVDFISGSIIIEKQLQRRPQSAGGTQLTPTKNGKARVLRPAPFVMQMLKIQRTEQIMQSLRAGERWEAWANEAEHRRALVFTNEDGRYLVAKRLYLHFKKIAEEIGAPDARVHDLRHTFAVISLQNGDDVKTVQTNLGHATAAFTLDVYGHVSDRMQRESAERMERYYNNVAQYKNA